MRGSLPTDSDADRIVLGLLTSVEADGARSQRHIAAELGIALGLVNAYLKRAVKKGLVEGQSGPGTSICLLSHTARLLREVAADD